MIGYTGNYFLFRQPRLFILFSEWLPSASNAMGTFRNARAVPGMDTIIVSSSDPYMPIIQYEKEEKKWKELYDPKKHSTHRTIPDAIIAVDHNFLECSYN